MTTPGSNEGGAAEATPGFWLFESFVHVQCGLVVRGVLANRRGRPADRRRSIADKCPPLRSCGGA